MANETYRLKSNKGYLNALFIDNLDGTHSLSVVDANGGLTDGLTNAQLRATPVPVLLPASELFLGVVGGKTTTVSVEFTRENNATPYSIGDVISGSAGTPLVYELPNIMRVNGGSGIVINTQVIFNVKSQTPTLKLNFFNSATPTVSGDNLLHQEKYVDTSKRLGYIDLPAMTTGADSTNSDMSRTMSGTSSAIPVKSAVDSRSIFVSLQTLAVVTLTALSKVTIIVTVLND